MLIMNRVCVGVYFLLCVLYKQAKNRKTCLSLHVDIQEYDEGRV